MKPGNPVLLVLIGVLTSSIAGTATLHVPGDFATIQAAIEAAANGDQISVGPGTYPEALDTHDKVLNLVGTAGADVTIVDGCRAGSVLRFAGGVVRGFTFRNGMAPRGGGLYLRALATTVVRNCVICDNTAHESGVEDLGVGGGICIEAARQGATVTIENNVIQRNVAGWWSAIALTDEGTPYRCVATIGDNLISGNGRECNSKACVLLRYECTFERNRVVSNEHGGVAMLGGTCSENTIAENPGLGLYVSGTNVLRNLVVGNLGYSGMDIGGIEAVQATLWCNDSWNNRGGDFLLTQSDTTGQYNLSADPLFCGPGDYQISTESPCFQALGCGLIGALPPACGVTAARRSTWGALKSLYR